jgi:AraC-like DNA-binding protein
MIASDIFHFPEHPQLEKIFDFIDSNYYQAIGLKEIALVFGYSPSYLTNLVRRLTGKTLYQWLVERRMFQARCLLLNTDLAVYQVAEAVGYEDAGHFIKHFRQRHTLPPKTWKENREEGLVTQISF